MTGSVRDDQTEDALSTVQRFHEAFNRHDVGAVMSLMTIDCVFDSTRPAPEGERVE